MLRTCNEQNSELHLQYNLTSTQGKFCSSCSEDKDSTWATVMSFRLCQLVFAAILWVKLRNVCCYCDIA